VPDYWRGAEYPHIRRLMFRFVANTNTRINQLKSGEVHVVALVPWDKFREISGMPSIVVHKTPGNAYEHVTLNERQVPAFTDLRVRRALLHALDRELYTRTILDGLAPVAHGPIQPVSWAYTDGIARYGFDPAAAKRLLDEGGAGHPARTESGSARQAARLHADHAGRASRRARNISQAIERQLRDVGVDVHVQLVDGTAISTLWFEGRFDAMLHWWQMPADPELTTFFAADRTPPAGRNINYYQNDELTTLLYASDRTVDREERKRLLQRAQVMVAEAVPELPALQHHAPRRDPGDAPELQGEPDQHRHLLERARVGRAVRNDLRPFRAGRWGRVGRVAAGGFQSSCPALAGLVVVSGFSRTRCSVRL
jgi:peptide/nickel transport system substrate-binding protein